MTYLKRGLKESLLTVTLLDIIHLSFQVDTKIAFNNFQRPIFMTLS